MSSASSEFDVIRTRIATYGDGDDTVLYAYQSKTAYIKDGGSVPCDPSSSKEQQNPLMDILTLLQEGFVSFQKPFGHAFRNYMYQLSRRRKSQTMRKKGPPSSFSYRESSGPTSPVGRREIDSQSIPEGGFNQSEESQEAEQESLDLEQKQKEREMFFSLSPRRLSADSYQPPIVPDNPLPGTSLMPSCTSPGAANNNSILPNAPASGAAPAALLTQGESSSVYTREMKSHSVFLGNKHTVPSIYGPSGCATSSPMEPDPCVATQEYCEDPLTWSVDEVILFLHHTDPQILGLIANLFRHHEIDGKALLLLTTDVMMNFMGLKLGTAMKLCHYIERLKEEIFYFN